MATNERLEWLEKNTRQVSRIYPGGARVNSDNYDPAWGWQAGAQVSMLFCISRKHIACVYVKTR